MAHFRHLILVAAFLVGSGSLARALNPIEIHGIKARVDAVMASVTRLMEGDPSARQAQVELNRSRLVIDLIQPYFYGIPGALHESSPGREERVAEIESLLTPHEGTLLRMLSASARSSQGPNAAATLLSFCRPTSGIREVLLSVAQDPQTDPQSAGEAYETLFMLELDDVQVRREVVGAIARRDERHTRAALASDILVRGSTRWALEELREKYEQFLSIPYEPANYPKPGGRARLRGDYNLAVRGLKAFGESGKDFIPALEARLTEMDPIADSDLIESAKETLLILNGEVPPRPVCNWKSRLLGVSKTAYPDWTRRLQSDTKQPVQTVSSAVAPAGKAHAKAEGGVQQPVQSESRGSWKWSLIAFAVIAGCGFLLLRRRHATR